MAALIGSVSEGVVLAENSTIMEPGQGLMSYVEVWSTLDFGKLVMPSAHINFFGDIFKLMTLDFPIFGDSNSPWQLVRWIILGPIIATIVFAMVVMFFSTVRNTLS